MAGGFPDLRYTPLLLSAEGFKAVVYDGVLTDNGMLSFKKALSPEDVEAIRAHLTSVANDLKKNPPPPVAGGGRGVGGQQLPPPPPGAKPYGTPESPPVGLYQAGKAAWPPLGWQGSQGPQSQGPASGAAGGGLHQ